MGILDNLKNIHTNPLAMAGLGLLSMPTESRYPLNPLAFAMQGAQFGVDNRLAEQRMAQEAAAQQQQQQEYQLRIAEYQRRVQAENEAAVAAQQQAAEREAWLANQPPEVQGLARAYPGLFEAQMKEQFKAPDVPAAVQTYKLAHPEDITLSGFDAWNRSNRASGATQVNLGRPMSISDLSKLVDAQGNPPPPGMSLEEAMASGYKIKPAAAPPVTEDERRSAGLAVRMENALKTMQELGSKEPAAQKPTMAQTLLKSSGDVGNLAARSTMSPARQQIEDAQLDALDAALTLATGAAYTKEQLRGLAQAYFPGPLDEPEVIAAKNARLHAVIETARIRAGRAAGSIDPIVNATPVTPGEQEWTTLPNGVKVRVKQ